MMHTTLDMPPTPLLPQAWRRATRSAVALGALLAGLASAPAAHAQQQDGANYKLPPLQLQRFRPGAGPSDYITVYGTGIERHMTSTFGVMVDAADDPMQVATHYAPYNRVIDEQVALSLTAALSIKDFVEVGLLLPATVFQGSEDLQPILPDGAPKSGDIQAAAIGDWRLSAKFPLLHPDPERPVSMALVTALSIPLASKNALASDEGVGGEAVLAADYMLPWGVRAGLNLGYRMRPGQRRIREHVVGNELLWGLAFQVPLFVRDLDAILEMAGSVGVASKRATAQGITSGEVPAEIRLAGRYRLTKGYAFQAGMGAALNPAIGAPDMRAFIGIGGHWVAGGEWHQSFGSPRFMGKQSPCPDAVIQPYDVLDPQGCPIAQGGGHPDESTLDSLNLRADESFAGTRTLPPRQEGEAARAVAQNGVIAINEPVHFETSRDEIKSESFEVLDAVATVMLQNPSIALVRVEGHTDNRGRPAVNLDLSQRRAEAVRRYLISKGVQPGRLQPLGFGQTRPVKDNETEEGRAFNRRVEFVILDANASPDTGAGR